MSKLLLSLPDWTPTWVLLPACDRDQRRLVLWSYGLMMRVRLMLLVVVLVEPVATRGMVTVLRRQSDALSTEVAAWRQAVRERSRTRSRKPPVLPPLTCNNPWV
jgi:hypothetical protein